MYAVCRRDDGAGQSTRREHVEINLDELRRAMEERGLKISRNNTEYLGTTSTETQRSIYWERLKQSEDIPDFGGYMENWMRTSNTECRADGRTGR